MGAIVKKMFAGVFAALTLVACERFAARTTVERGADTTPTEVTQQEVRSTEQLIVEVNDEFNALEHELNNANLLVEDETMRFFGGIRDKRDRMNFLVGRYNESLMAGAEREALAFKGEVDALANEILTDISVLREKKHLLINPENISPAEGEPF
jgi:hypothetical protein